MTGPGPRRHIEPLPPPPGQFDAVFREASARRYHRAAAALGITGVFLAGIFGGLALGGPSGVRATIASAMHDPSATSTPSPVVSSTLASNVPKHGRKHGGAAPATGTVTAPPEPVASTYIRGEVLDAAGTPVPGLYVYSGVNTAQGFVPNPTPARTNGVGWYQLPCTGGPLLITSWRINSNLGPTADGGYAARFVDTPSCANVQHHLVTRVEKGAVLQGHVDTDVACPGAEFPLWLWIGGDRNAAIRLSGLHHGDRYRISGAPEGTSVLGARGVTHAVTLRSGETDEQDVTYTCPGVPTETPDPGDSSEPPPPEPTGSTTPTEPSPSGSTAGSGGTSSPDPSAH
jgi:hypothetical protein